MRHAVIVLTDPRPDAAPRHFPGLLSSYQVETARRLARAIRGAPGVEDRYQVEVYRLPAGFRLRGGAVIPDWRSPNFYRAIRRHNPYSPILDDPRVTE